MSSATVHYLKQPDNKSQEGYNLKSKFTRVPNWILDACLPPYEATLLIQIARKSIGWNKRTAYIGMTELERSMGGVSKNTIKKSRDALIKKGIILVGKTTGGRNAKTAYTINENCKDSGALNTSGDDPFNGEKGSGDDPFIEEERGQEMTPARSGDDPFNGEKGSGDDHAKIKTVLKDNQSKDSVGHYRADESIEKKKAKPFCYSKKVPLPDGFAITEGVRAWAEQKGHDRLDEHFEHFCLVAEARGYKYANWNSAFQTAVRCNWAKLVISRRPAKPRPAVEDI